MYSVLYHIHKDVIVKDAERVNKYNPYLNEFDWSGIKFPVQLKDILKVEKLIDFGINVFGYEKSAPFPLHITKRQDDKVINLLLVADLVNDRKVESIMSILKNLIYLLHRNVTLMMELIRIKIDLSVLIAYTDLQPKIY